MRHLAAFRPFGFAVLKALKAFPQDKNPLALCGITRIHSPEEVLECLRGKVQPDPVLFLQA